jgi:acyl carrier protein
MNTVYDRLAMLITGGFGIPEREISPQVTFGDLELDSIALVELALAVEEEFGVKIPDGELSDTDDLARAAHLIAAGLGGDVSVPSGTKP